jgi:hypothetical protein
MVINQKTKHCGEFFQGDEWGLQELAEGWTRIDDPDQNTKALTVTSEFGNHTFEHNYDRLSIASALEEYCQALGYTFVEPKEVPINQNEIENIITVQHTGEKGFYCQAVVQPYFPSKFWINQGDKTCTSDFAFTLVRVETNDQAYPANTDCRVTDSNWQAYDINFTLFEHTFFDSTNSLIGTCQTPSVYNIDDDEITIKSCCEQLGLIYDDGGSMYASNDTKYASNDPKLTLRVIASIAIIAAFIGLVSWL